MDKSYISSAVDLIIIASTLVLISSFSVTHELAERRKNEILDSGAFSIRQQIRRVQAYLVLSIWTNVAALCFTIWLFWPVESLLLFLLTYKGMQSLVNGLVYWNEVRISAQYTDPANDVDSTVFFEPKTKHWLKLLDILIDGVYIGAIVWHKGFSVRDFMVAIYIVICFALMLSKLWTLYKEFSEFSRIECAVFSMYESASATWVESRSFGW